MSGLLRLFTSGLCLAIILGAVPALAEVEWSTAAYDEIIGEAKTSGKYVFIDFYTVWCGPCKKMDKETYVDAGVVEFLGEMIPVKYDAEKGAGIELAKKYNVYAYPTVILVDSSGEEIDRYLGYLGAEDFLKVMTDYKNGIGTVTYFEALIEENPDDPELWMKLGTRHADAGRTESAVEALNKYLAMSPGASDEEVAEVKYTIARAYYDGEMFDESARKFQNFVTEYEGTEWQDSGTTMLARCYYYLGDKEKCVSTYLLYVDRNPDNPKALNSFAWFCATKNVGLDEALPVALKAVELTDRDPGYLDTLAELYYARGEFDEAIEVGKEALDKDPEDQYLSDQLDKFKKAKEEAEKRAQE